jgi:hypothetical protein
MPDHAEPRLDRAESLCLGPHADAVRVPRPSEAPPGSLG